MLTKYFTFKAFHQLALKFLKAHDSHFIKQYFCILQIIFLELCIVF